MSWGIISVNITHLRCIEGSLVNLELIYISLPIVLTDPIDLNLRLDSVGSHMSGIIIGVV